MCRCPVVLETTTQQCNKGYSRSVWKSRFHTKDRGGFSKNCTAINKEAEDRTERQNLDTTVTTTVIWKHSVLLLVCIFTGQRQLCVKQVSVVRKTVQLLQWNGWIVYLTYDFSDISNLNWLLVWIKRWHKIYIRCGPEARRGARDVSYCSHFCCCAIIPPRTNVPGSISPLNNPDFECYWSSGLTGSRLQSITKAFRRDSWKMND